jgi:glycosyltransferase involved in cell wall biosynthesis
MSQPISVLLCTRNRPAKLHRAIGSILANSYRNFELVVVDQSIDGESRTKVESFRDSRLVYIPTTTVGLSRARNIAIRAAQWDIVAFTDDDCICDSDWLSSIVAEYERDPPRWGLGTGRRLRRAGARYAAPPDRGARKAGCRRTRTATGSGPGNKCRSERKYSVRSACLSNRWVPAQA